MVAPVAAVRRLRPVPWILDRILDRNLDQILDQRVDRNLDRNVDPVFDWILDRSLDRILDRSPKAMAAAQQRRPPSGGFDGPCAWARVQVARVPPPATDAHMSMDNFGRLHLWSWTEYSRVVYIDADCMVMRDISGLFQLPVGITAAVGARRHVWFWV